MSSNKTRHLALNYLDRGDSVTDEDWKYGTTDRDRLDLAAWLGATAHHHNGEPFSSSAPGIGPYLVLDNSGGTLPAGTSIFYKYSLVDDRGLETLASPETYITTPDAVSAPSAPTFTIIDSGGIILPGAYSYALSAYKDANTLETTAPNVTSVLLPAGVTSYQVQLNLPALPLGASGFNVYRRAPGETSYHYIASVDMEVATPPTEWVDDGTVAGVSTRGLPAANTTNAQNAVQVWLPGATPAVPEGYTWKIYRTIIPGVYTSSFLHHVVEETTEGSGIIAPNYLDLGYRTASGQPATVEFGLDNPEKIQLTDAEEVQGILPPASIVYRDCVRWFIPGTVVNTIGEEAWTCYYDVALIKCVVISLGKNSLAGGQADIVDILKYDAQIATPVWDTIFTDQAGRPTIPVGDYVSNEAVPDVTALFRGDRLVYNIEQAGNLATPTDEDLWIEVHIYYWDSTATSVVQPT